MDAPVERSVPVSYESPENLVELLNGIAALAARTRFFGSILSADARVRTLNDFRLLPVTPLSDYRRQRLADVLAQPERVDAILGRYRGHDPCSVAVAEGTDEGAERFDIFTDAVKGSVELGPDSTCVVLTGPGKRYFAAEIATILIRSGAVAHVFLDRGGPGTYETLRLVRPRVLVLLTRPVDEAGLPPSVELCVTFRRSQRMERLPQLDLFVVDELGFLGQSQDGEGYVLNGDSYYFERSERGRLIVTSLFNRVQPLLRIETQDIVGPLGGETVVVRHSSSPMC